MDVDRIQAVLQQFGMAGWLFFDHHRRDALSYKILELPPTVHPTRRWYYFIPSSGVATALVHRIESHTLDSLPGRKIEYSSWQEQQDHLAEILSGRGKVAMQYSPKCAVPYVSFVDGGTIELIAATGVEIVSSADLVQLFEAVWSESQRESHFRAGKVVDEIRRAAFLHVGSALREGKALTEFDVQQLILHRFASAGLVTDSGPIVAVNQHAADPHYEPSANTSSEIRRGDLLLIDMWAKLNTPDAVYYDITWTGFCGDEVPELIHTVFDVVRTGRDKAVQRVQRAIAEKRDLRGYEVDDAAREYIASRGYGDAFIHRTGHSIGTDVHGAGANMDNLESHDERRVIARTCFSVEPGIYLSDFGIRSEVNVYVGEEEAVVTGEAQTELLRLGSGM